jgi:hypothetical protein
MLVDLRGGGVQICCQLMRLEAAAKASRHHCCFCCSVYHTFWQMRGAAATMRKGDMQLEDQRFCHSGSEDLGPVCGGC